MVLVKTRNLRQGRSVVQAPIGFRIVRVMTVARLPPSLLVAANLRFTTAGHTACPSGPRQAQWG